MICPKQKNVYCSLVDRTVTPEFCEDCKGFWIKCKRKGLHDLVPKNKYGKLPNMHICRLCYLKHGSLVCGKQPDEIIKIDKCPVTGEFFYIEESIIAMRIQYCGQVCGRLHNDTCKATPCKIKSGWVCPEGKWPKDIL